MSDLVPRFDNSTLAGALNRDAIALNNTAKSTNDTAHNLAAEATVAGRSRHTFQNVYYSYMGGESAGILENNVHYHIRGAGAPVSSQVDTHLSLLGDASFFPVQDANGNQYFTRVGTFGYNAENKIQNHFGMQLLYAPAVNGVLPTNLSNTSLSVLDCSSSNLSSNAIQTSEITFRCGLSGNIGSSVTRAVSVYDSSGTPRTLNYVFTRNADWADSSGTGQSWSLTIQAPANSTINGAYSAGDPSNSVPANPVIINFDPTNKYPLSFNGNTTPPDLNITCPGGASITPSMNLGTVGQPDGVIVINGGQSRLQVQVNGQTSGAFKTLNFDENGNIYGNFDNGKSELIGRLVVGCFNNPDGLEMLEKGLYLQNNSKETIGNTTYNKGSGDVTYCYIGENSAGKVAVGALESSTVEIIPQMAQMIERLQRFNNMTTVFNSIDELYDALNSIGG